MEKIEKITRGRRLERFFKGPANYRRIDILFFILENKESTLFNIADGLKTKYKIIAQHTEKLVTAGLLNKKYVGNSASLKLSPYGEKLVKFMKSF
ncbi:hypothetical protein KJ603_00350 [Patescibacteria group bacterium]|nr:hypothetical protein [Patescibacteria group bacterium]